MGAVRARNSLPSTHRPTADEQKKKATYSTPNTPIPPLSPTNSPQGLKRIAARVHGLAAVAATALTQAGYAVDKAPFFDTIRVDVSSKGERGLRICLGISFYSGITPMYVCVHNPPPTHTHKKTNQP